MFGLFKKKNKNNIQKEVAFRSDVMYWYYDNALECYLKIHNKSIDDLEEIENSTIMQYAGNHIVYFFTWIIENDFYNTKEVDLDGEEEETLYEDLASVKNRTKTAYWFMCNYCDCKLWRVDFDDKILGFVDSYYLSSYMIDYSNFIKDDLGKEIYGVGFSWTEYDDFKKIIDIAYAGYLKEIKA